MKRKELQNKLIEHIIEGKGSQDKYYISGSCGYCVNDILEYVTVYKAEEIDGEIFIEESFFQYPWQLEHNPMKGFFKSTSERVRMNKVRKFINEYMY